MCVCALACPGHPGMRRSRFPVGTTDIPALVNQAPPHCASAVSERRISGSQTEARRAEGNRCGWGVVGGGTDVCLWDVRTLCISEPSLLLKVQPALQTIKGRNCHHDPLSLSHFRNNHPASVSAVLPWQSQTTGDL